MRTFPFVLLFLLTLCFVGCRQRTEKFDQGVSAPSTENPPIAEITSEPIRRAIERASEQTKTTTGYTQQYFDIPYPNGDLPEDTGACTDVIVRAFRNAGVDLQKEVHEDMARNFSDYPRKWGLSKTDTNIDHRRVPNLQTYFQRKGKSLPIRSIGDNYQPGDVVSWDLDGKGMTHIGIVSISGTRQRNATS